MDVAAHIEVIRREGVLLASAAERASLDRAVPTCPGWTVRDVVGHLGRVHRWAAAHVAQARSTPLTGDEEAELFVTPGDAALLGWFRDGHRALVDTLTAAPADLQCWTFLAAPTPLAFWARRQAHETTIHRVDVESAMGTVTPVAAEVASDGVDELLTGFVTRPRTGLRADPPRTLHVHATDTPGEWLVRIGPHGLETSREHAKGDTALRGPASDLYLLLWNRAGAEGVDVLGDATLLDIWREGVRIRWS